MQFQQINTMSVADSVGEQVKSLILNGCLKPGEKLPSERSLAAEFNVSRTSIRQGIALLIDIGLLETHRDGTYVCSVISPSLVEPFSQLFGWYPKALSDMLELRLLLQSQAIELAMDKLCDSDKKTLHFFYQKMQDAFTQKKKILEGVANLHLAIIDCSYNIVLTTVLRGILSLLKNALDDNIDIIHLSQLQFVQECLYKAIVNGDKTTDIDMLNKHINIIKQLSIKSKDNEKPLEKTPFSQEYLIDKASSRIEHLIICQHFEISKPIPSIAQLAEEVDEKDPKIIESALATLRDKSLLFSKDNTLFITPKDAKPLINDPLAHLIIADWSVALDVFELRIILENNSSSQASKNQDYDKRQYLKNCLSQLLVDGSEYDPRSNALDDYEYHLAIADLSGNLATTYLMRGLFNLLRSSISSWLALFNKEVGDISIIQRQHIDVCDAILNNDSQAAHDAMHEHLSYIIRTVQRIAAKK